MSVFDAVQSGVFLLTVVVLVKPVGQYLEQVFERRRTFLDPVLLPVSLLGSVFLIAQGVPMNFRPYTVIHTVGGDVQTIAQGPVAALE